MSSGVVHLCHSLQRYARAAAAASWLIRWQAPRLDESFVHGEPAANMRCTVASFEIIDFVCLNLD